jgi:hypothetical protein
MDVRGEKLGGTHGLVNQRVMDRDGSHLFSVVYLSNFVGSARKVVVYGLS